MSLHPLLAAPTLFQVHAFLAMTAFVLGIVQFAAPKGTLPHRTLGYVWVSIMLVVAASSFGIQGLNPGHFTWVHLTSIMVLIVTPIAVLHARRGRVRRHAIAMVSLFIGTLVIAGAFTFWPGRIMHRVVFGALDGGVSVACS